MFFFTAKLTPAKLIAGAAAVILVAVCVVWFFSSTPDAAKDVNNSVNPPGQTDSAPQDAQLDTETLSAFLHSYGWQVNGKPEEKVVKIPKEFDDVFKQYNQMQQEQGFDLSKLKGEKVTRYTFSISNYPNASEEIVANVLVHSNKIIGGDICTKRIDGFMHGFCVPGSQPQTTSAQDGQLDISASGDKHSSDPSAQTSAEPSTQGDIDAATDGGEPTDIIAMD